MAAEALASCDKRKGAPPDEAAPAESGGLLGSARCRFFGGDAASLDVSSLRLGSEEHLSSNPASLSLRLQLILHCALATVGFQRAVEKLDLQ